VTALALSLDGTRLLTGGGRSVTDRQTGKGAPAAGPLHLWDRTSGRCLATWDAHAGAVTAVALTGDGRFAFSAGTDRLLKVWEAETGRCLRTFAGHADAVTSLALARDARFAVTGGADRFVRVWLLDWRLEERSPADWDEAARPLVEAFRARRRGPTWTEDDFEALLEVLGGAGFGWLRPEGVRTATRSK
jgi:WD40 repeat protein